MTRLHRLLYYLVILLFFFFLSITFLPRSQPTTIKPTSPHHSTKYLSWLPHGEFTDQHEAFRNAIRLGQEMNRTVIVPMLRLGKPLLWQPFEQLEQAYRNQDKNNLRQICETEERLLNDPVCTTLNDWTEIPWSSLFNLKAISIEFNIPIIERTKGHGWGLHDTAVMDITDVVVIDAMTYSENTTFIPMDKKTTWGFLGRQFNQRIMKQQEEEEEEYNTNAGLPLKTVIKPTQWKDVEHRQYIQFGALSSTPRYQVHSTSRQMALRKALNRHLLVTPDQMAPLKAQADSVITTLGGMNHFSSLRLNFAKVIALDARVNKNATTSMITMDDLDTATQKELMDAVVLEVFGDIPINQAVSAAMPVNPDSKLARVLMEQRQQPSSSSFERQQLLDACIDYRENIEHRYPIYYLVNDHIPSPATRPDIYGPLLSFFPCLFTKNDMKQWNKLDMVSWPSTLSVLQDQGVDYEIMLDPMLDILIAGQGKHIYIYIILFYF
ncbi:uncharacterized protein BX664DRAFT_335748 [Halteromyces radiatus]|uniref:uncharacterized protein n=1 Tax=Halteromyces radiatus TaxID=101107 RepID=UPI0022205624|nr:uncharacterized protein BX664DRAFT_335748 [Halteromyces radiatus]KAI8086418.1 hypothetical protein BX664DRAFT_335748 [Halteromyces radiatus]